MTQTISYIIHYTNRKFFQTGIQKIRGRFFFYNESMSHIFEYDETNLQKKYFIRYQTPTVLVVEENQIISSRIVIQYI